MAETNEALGMIETRGLVGMIEATDAMMKAAKPMFMKNTKLRRRTA